MTLDANDRLRDGTLPHNPFTRAEPYHAHWEKPVPLDDLDHLPDFPIAELPDVLGDWATAESEATQTPVDLPAVLSLAVVSLLSAKRYEVEVRKGWREPMNTFWLVALGSGERKSAVFRSATLPVREHEQTLAEQFAREFPTCQARREIKERKYKQALERASKSEDSGDLEQALHLAVEVDELVAPPAPRLFADDVTPERLAMLLAEHDGRMAVLSAEGGIFDTLAGRYSSGVPNIDVFLKGYSGDPLLVDRVRPPPIHVPAPALTAALTVQPHVIRCLTEARAFRGRGLLARFFFSLPRSRVGARDVSPPAVPDEVVEAYRSLCSRLVERFGDRVTTTIPLDEAAHEELMGFAKRYEQRLGPGGDLEPIQDWACKLVGGVARVAGLLALAEAASTPGGIPANLCISRILISRAIAIATYLVAHARAAFELMGADPSVEVAKELLCSIRRISQPIFTKRDLYLRVRGRDAFKTTAALDAPLSVLVAHSYIRALPAERRTSSGRPSSPSYERNPLDAQNPQNAQNPRRAVGDPGSDNGALKALTL